MNNQSASLLHDALDHLHSALDLLDRAAAPAQIGAHVDLALHQLRSVLGERAEEIEPMPVDQGALRH